MGADFEELGRASIVGSRSYSLKSRNVDQTFQIDVARPSARAAEGKKLPVVYVLDGNGCFGLATQTARMLQDGGLAPALIVGVGYRFDPSLPLRAQTFETRTRDYTPTEDAAWLETSRRELAKQGVEIGGTTGGAPAFLRFLEDELKPFIAAHYPIDAADQTLTGMSLGGLFTLYAFFAAPQNFARYAAFSPSLWWDKRSLFANEAALAARTRDVTARLFLSVGDKEEDADGIYRMVSNLQAMKDTLAGRNYPGLKLSHTVFGEETHMSVYPAAFSRGLRALFGEESAQRAA